MAAPYLFKPADLGGEISDLCNQRGNPLFRSARLVWSRPKKWNEDGSAPTENLEGAHLYVIVRNHWKARRKDVISYVGLTVNPGNRFRVHHVADQLRQFRGETAISFAPMDFIKGKNLKFNQKKAMEEIEHILIWLLGPEWNDRKNFTLPGMGSGGAHAWHIQNAGYRFGGGMPLEIVFPWMLARWGRDRTQKFSST